MIGGLPLLLRSAAGRTQRGSMADGIRPHISRRRSFEIHSIRAGRPCALVRVDCPAAGSANVSPDDCLRDRHWKSLQLLLSRFVEIRRRAFPPVSATLARVRR